ncbi:unnamed protein product, partial [Phaeothamnion confervicola]
AVVLVTSEHLRPQHLRVPCGALVRWRMEEDGSPHSLTDGELGVSLSVTAARPAVRRFDRPGQYDVRDEVMSWITGTVDVT